MKIKKLIRFLKTKVTGKKVVEDFHKFYYYSGVCNNKTFWRGHIIVKCPMDLVIYQEIIHEVQPDIIIECGTAEGGGALFLADMCELNKKGKVISIDIVQKDYFPKHERITYIDGSTVDKEIFEKVKTFIKPKDKVLVILDSDHHKKHVLKEMRMYSKLVTNGSYMIVEDSNVNGNPVYPEYGEGAHEAIIDFMMEGGIKEFEYDHKKEKLHLTFNPDGYLRRIKNG